MSIVEKLSIREAVKHFDVSRPTLTKALKTGKVSGVQDGQGQWQLDPAELARVYPGRATPPSGKMDNPVNPTEVIESEIATFYRGLAGQVEALRESLAEAEKRAASAEAAKNEILAEKRIAEALAEERAQRVVIAEALAEERARHLDDLRRLLPPPSEAPSAPAPRRRWWPF